MRDGWDVEGRWEDEGGPGGEDRERLGSRCGMEGLGRGGTVMEEAADGTHLYAVAGKLREGGEDEGGRRK